VTWSWADQEMKTLAEAIPVGETRRIMVAGVMYRVTNNGHIPWPEEARAQTRTTDEEG
jgi:hypothetical protein